MNTYKTSEVASIIGIHPNTVRLYEKLELITKPARMANGYRIFTDLQVEQCRLIRIAFQVEIVQNGLRKKIVAMLKTAATKDFDGAAEIVWDYLSQVRQERLNAEEAIEIVREILSGDLCENIHFMKRKEVSDALDISMDTLRNWELNGLLTVKRRNNGYRVYTDQDIQRLKIIRCLRCANYSLEAILRLLNRMSRNPDVDIRQTLNTPGPSEDIVSVCDRLIVSLTEAENNACIMLDMLQNMKKRFS